MRDYLNVLKRYATFSGRSRRREFWMFSLVNLLVMFIMSLIDILFLPDLKWNDGTGLLLNIYWFATLIPFLALIARRLHDTGRSGWLMLFSLVPLAGAIVLLIYTTHDSAPGLNKWGPNPKDLTVQAAS